MGCLPQGCLTNRGGLTDKGCLAVVLGLVWVAGHAYFIMSFLGLQIDEGHTVHLSLCHISTHQSVISCPFMIAGNIRILDVNDNGVRKNDGTALV